MNKSRVTYAHLIRRSARAVRCRVRYGGDGVRWDRGGGRGCPSLRRNTPMKDTTSISTATPKNTNNHARAHSKCCLILKVSLDALLVNRECQGRVTNESVFLCRITRHAHLATGAACAATCRIRCGRDGERRLRGGGHGCPSLALLIVLPSGLGTYTHTQERHRKHRCGRLRMRLGDEHVVQMSNGRVASQKHRDPYLM